MSNLTKKFFALVGISLLLVSCGANTTCDAYSYIQNKNQEPINQKQEVKKQTLQKVNQITHVEYETI